MYPADVALECVACVWLYSAAWDHSSGLTGELPDGCRLPTHVPHGDLVYAVTLICTAFCVQAGAACCRKVSDIL
jgi:hypothetical protein